MYDVHQEIAFLIDPYLDIYETDNKIWKLRKELLSYAKGYILETAVGTSRNLYFYPNESKVLATDWSSNMLDMALRKIVPSGLNIDYKLEDTEKMTFIDNVFDTVVDTFGLESYAYPEKALKEMKRVCKNGGKILLLASGLTEDEGINKAINKKASDILTKYGYIPNREWEPLIKNMDFEIERFERKMNGSIYFYVLKNVK